MLASRTCPLDTESEQRPPSGRYHRSLEALLTEASARKVHTRTDTAWALKLKSCMDAVVRELHVDVISAKPLEAFDEEDNRDMRFEVATTRGNLEVVRVRSGTHLFNWK